VDSYDKKYKAQKRTFCFKKNKKIKTKFQLNRKSLISKALPV
jgi:hypothetical protein